jgi:thiol-disulfide isomerase/thioredoxin
MSCRPWPAYLILALGACNQATPAPPPSSSRAESPPAASTPSTVQDSSSKAAKNAVTQSDEASHTETRDKKSAARAAVEDGPIELDKSPPPDNRKSTNAKVTVAKALELLEDAASRREVQEAGRALEQALESDPKNLKGLIAAAEITRFLGRRPARGESGDANFHKSADYVRRAVKVKPQLAQDDEFRSFAVSAALLDASVFARQEKAPQCLAALREAVEFGFSRLEMLKDDEDFADKLPPAEFAAFLKEAQERIKVLAAEEVGRLLASNKPFAFNFDVEDIAGNRVSKKALRGKVVIVDFWGTWCPPCKMEIPHFVALDREFRDKGLQVVGMSEERGDSDEENAATVRDFCKSEGVTYPCALATEKIKDQIPDFEGFPTTLFLDRTGRVRLQVTGYREVSFLRAAVEALLNEPFQESAGKPADTTGH